MRVTVRRGCPFSCSYCFNAPFRRMTKGLGPYIRTRSPEHVIEELAYLHQRYGCRHIIFSDDVFTLSRKWIFDFAQQMARLPMTYDIATCAQYLDRDVVRALAESGCTLVGMGIETGDEALRRGLLNKKLKNEEIFRAARELARAGIQVQTYNMIGFPGETLDHALETIRFNQRIKPDYALCCIATPYPGTSLSQRWTAIEGTSEKEILSLVGKSFFHRSLLPGKEARLFTNLQKFFALAVRHPSLEPLVRLLVRLPPNPVFHEFFQLYHGLHMMRRLKASPIFALSLFFRLRRHF
ncbi:MAG: radical SAM protein [Pseudomonadota bacterium]